MHSPDSMSLLQHTHTCSIIVVAVGARRARENLRDEKMSPRLNHESCGQDPEPNLSYCTNQRSVCGTATLTMTSRSSLVTVALLLSSLTTAFLVPCNSRSISRRSAFHVPRCLSSTSSSIRPATSLRAKKKDEEDEDIRDGMAEAFRELDALGSLEDDHADSQPKLNTDKTAKGFQEVDLVLPKSETMPSTPEAEVRLYKDMYTESEKGETELYSDVLADMGGSPNKKQPPAKGEQNDPLELIEALERTPEDLDMFMNNALAEARVKTPDELKAYAENALDDEEMMKEIEEVFDKANKELLASLEDIRTEQVRQLHCSVKVAIECIFSKSVVVSPICGVF